MKKLVFITGGARSGKSRFALEKASRVRGEKALIATAEACDEEMRQRIEKHRLDRGSSFITFEEPFRISDVLEEIDGFYQAVVIDCLTLWVANIMLRNESIDAEVERLLMVIQNLKSDALITVVSNEVGMGIVPEHELSRKYRDAAGFLNQKVAEIADEVYLTVSGIPLQLK